MIHYEIGKKVVCIYQGEWTHWYDTDESLPTALPVFNEIYTIKDIENRGREAPLDDYGLHELVLYFEELGVQGYSASAFRPLEEQPKTSIEIFKKMLNPKPELEIV